MNINFSNGLEGKEHRMYRLRSDPRQYYLIPLVQASVEEEDVITGETIKIPKLDALGEPVYNEGHAETYKDMGQILKRYLEKEGWDNNAETFKELRDIYVAAVKLIQDGEVLR